MQKRLAIFLPSLAGGGAERSMLNMANGFAGRGVALDMVLASATGPYLEAVSEGVRVVDLKSRRVLSSLPGLVRYLRRERPDAMLSSLDYANIVSLWARRLAGGPRKVVVYEHNTMSVTSRQSKQARQRLMPRMVKLFYPWADCIAAVSGGVADDLCRLTGFAGSRVRVIYNPVVTPDLQEKVKAPLDHPWLRPGQPPVVLAVGRLTEQKDFPTLIRAFARVRQARQARLIILGEGPDREDLQALTAELGLSDDVSLTGFVDNPYAYLARASLFVLSSRWEGLPTVLIEALYCGVPVVATDCPSGPREILAGGKYGTLVPMQDVEALAEAIGKGLDGETPRPCRESWQPYELGTIVDQYLRLLLDEG
ncbi:MAG TPA: glycosyltransferase [Chloroflexia bacterium]|nr:glycosyltransferase [Chloroflexia bacterium]